MTDQVLEECIRLSKKLNWYDTCLSYGVFDINKLIEIIPWSGMFSLNPFSEEFMREFQDHLNWHQLSIHQDLSEEFIREFQFRVNWYWVSVHQTLTTDFVREFITELSWDGVLSNPKINLSEEFIYDMELILKLID